MYVEAYVDEGATAHTVCPELAVHAPSSHALKPLAPELTATPLPCVDEANVPADTTVQEEAPAAE